MEKSTFNNERHSSWVNAGHTKDSEQMRGKANLKTKPISAKTKGACKKDGHDRDGLTPAQLPTKIGSNIIGLYDGVTS